MRIQCCVLAAALVMAGGITGFGQTKVWSGGGDGVSWTNRLNWNPTTVPGASDTVSITGGSGTRVVIWPDNDVTVKSIQCSKPFVVSGGSLTLTAGSSQFSGAFTLTNTGWLLVQGSGATVTANSTTLLADGWLSASGGATIQLPKLYAVTNVNASPTWEADGTGSTIDLSSVTNLIMGSSDILTIQASGGGKVDLHLVTNTVGAVDVSVQDAGTSVNLNGLAGRWKSRHLASITLQAQTGGRRNRDRRRASARRTGR